MRSIEPRWRQRAMPGSNQIDGILNLACWANCKRAIKKLKEWWQIRGETAAVSCLTNGRIVAMLCILLDIKQREYLSALKRIEEAYPQSG